MNRFYSTTAAAAAASILAAAATVEAAPVVTRVAGPSAASIQGGVDAFRASLGTLNPNVAGSFGSGRREINWDGVPDTLAAPGNLPADFYNAASPRGVVIGTPGTGFQVSASTASAVPVEFGNVDPTYPGLFAAFSAQRLFTAIGSNVVDVTFFVPGSATAAFTTGFGVVFTDVDLADTTNLQFFDVSGTNIGTFFAPSFAGDQTLSFLGVRFDGGERISRVRIVSGNQALSGREVGDLVVMDDFVYAEPIAIRATDVPEPAPWALLLLPLATMLSRRWPRNARRTAGDPGRRPAAAASDDSPATR